MVKYMTDVYKEKPELFKLSRENAAIKISQLFSFREI